MSHFCLVVCSAIGRSESGVCIALVLGIIVTTPEVHVSGILPTSRKRFSDSYICGSKMSENLLKNLFFFLTRDRSSTKCPLRVHIAGHGLVTGPTLGMGLV